MTLLISFKAGKDLVHALLAWMLWPWKSCLWTMWKFTFCPRMLHLSLKPNTPLNYFFFNLPSERCCHLALQPFLNECLLAEVSSLAISRTNHFCLDHWHKMLAQWPYHKQFSQVLGMWHNGSLTFGIRRHIDRNKVTKEQGDVASN